MTDKSTADLTDRALPDGSGPNIALRAYQLWDAAGRPEGRSEEFYFQAEEELRRLLELES
jgi:hypothetical protein